jgi:hypothetical protein
MREQMNEALAETLAKRLPTKDFRRDVEAWERLDPEEARAVPIIGSGVSGTVPGTDPQRDADLSRATPREVLRGRIIEEIRRLRAERGCDDPVVSKREVAAMIGTGVQNLLDARDDKSHQCIWETYMFEGRPDLPPDLNWQFKSHFRMLWLRSVKVTSKEHRAYRDGAIADAIRYWPANDREMETLADEVIGFKTSKSQINRVRQTIPKKEQALHATESPTLVQRVSEIEARLVEVEGQVGLPQGGPRATREMVEELLAQVAQEQSFGLSQE